MIPCLKFEVKKCIWFKKNSNKTFIFPENAVAFPGVLKAIIK